MNLIKKIVVSLILLSAAFFQAAAQGQVTSLSNTPTQASHLTSGNGFSISGNDQSQMPDQIRDVDEWINIGNNSSPWGSYNYPVDFYMNTSLTQSIYTAEEMNHSSSLIEQVKYIYKTVSTNYPNVINTESFKVWICNTDQSSLSAEAGYWIPLEEFTLVFDGGLVLNGGVGQEMLFELTQPFVYNEANICIMVEHVFSTNTFENHFNFEASTLAEGDVRARLYVSYDTPFNFELPTTDPSQTGMSLGQLADVKLGISTASEGSLSGTVTNSDGAPVAGAKVVVQGAGLQTFTNAQGFYDFPVVLPDTYIVNYTAFGYVNASVSLNISGATTKNLVLTYLPKAIVSGTVLDNDNNPIAGAAVNISGYAPFTGTTNASGLFSIPGVYYDANYAVTVSKNGYQSKFSNLDVNIPAVSMGTIKLTDILDKPSKVVAAKNAAVAEISWLSPSERTVFRRDGDNMVSQIGHNYAGEVCVFGQVWREPAKLYQMSWFLNNVDYPHETVNVYVFALNAQGNPTNTILFEQANVPNVDLEWTTFTFPDTLTIQNGFYISLSYSLRLELGIDGGTDPQYPYVNGVNWVSENYGSNEFLLMEDLGLGTIPGNLMIRAEGYNLNTGAKLQSPVGESSRSLNAYNISRLKEGQEQNPELWTVLNANVTATNYTDNSFGDAEPGWYKFAVNSVYSGNVPSLPAFSNRIENKLTTKVTFNITTNTPTNESFGAVITLINNDGSVTYTESVLNANGVAVMPVVFKGIYSVLISHDGFNNLLVSNVDLSTDPAYTLNYELIETLLKPFNLNVNLHQDYSATFEWNYTADILEDFESCTDFEINPQGVVNWKYLDADKKNTIGISNFTYLNENSPHAFMIFTPSMTTPPIDVQLNPSIAPHSRNKFLASFGATHGANDDYLISPELNFGKNFKFSFWAKSFDNDPAPNTIMVGYSTTGFQPEDFTWITATPIAVPHANWKKYTYDLTPDVKHVTIRNVSNGGYILMIDDVEIYAAPSTRELVNYQVYLNGTLKGQTTDQTFDFATADILVGQTNVAGVKAIYSTGESVMSTVEFLGGFVDVPQELLPGNMKVYPNPSNGSFTIELDGEYQVTILNSLGAKVYNKTISKKELVTMKDLTPGMYIISATSDQKAAFKTIIVQ